MFKSPPKDVHGWTVYILKCADETFYTGITNDLENRLEKHSKGAGAKYTRGRGPFDVVYKERLESHGDALRREREIKKLSRTAKLLLTRG